MEKETHSSLSNLKENSILSIEMGPKSDKELPNPDDNVPIEEDEQTLRNELLIQAEFTFFIFVNPSSGGNLAADFLELGTEKMNLHIKLPKTDRIINVDLFIFDLKNNPNKERGFKLLRLLQHQGVQNIRIIVGGGDGTVMWVVHEMLEHSCNISQTPVGIVPFGTGNDLARVLGWGGGVPSEFLGKNLSGLRKMIEKWVVAKSAPLDIWDIKLKTCEDGSFLRVVNENGKAVKSQLRDSNGELIHVLTKSMSNYFSIGIDARIGLGFDKHRTKSQLGNKCVYCWEGMKKLFLKDRGAGKVLDALEVIHDADVANNRISDIDISIHSSDQTQKEVIFNTRSASMALTKNQLQQLQEQQRERIEKRKQNNILKGNPACLLMLNINSYAGGTNKIWKSSQGQIGLEKSSKKEKIDDSFEEQSFGDGMVEFVSFTSGISLANERFFSGQASRVAQGKGPFKLSFKKSDGSQGTPIISYFQIDGEYYQVIAPESISIKHNKKFPEGKIQMLVNTVGNSY